MQQLLFANPELIFSDTRCCHRKAHGPDAGKQQQVEGSRPREEPRKAFWGGRGLHWKLGWWKATRLLAVGMWEIEDLANELGASIGDSGLSFKVLLVFQLSTAEHKSRDELVAAATTKPKLFVFKEILDEVCDRYENR